jgi:hypothetical protein
MIPIHESEVKTFVSFVWNSKGSVLHWDQVFSVFDNGMWPALKLSIMYFLVFSGKFDLKQVENSSNATCIPSPSRSRQCTVTTLQGHIALPGLFQEPKSTKIKWEGKKSCLEIECFVQKLDLFYCESFLRFVSLLVFFDFDDFNLVRFYFI